MLIANIFGMKGSFGRCLSDRRIGRKLAKGIAGRFDLILGWLNSCGIELCMWRVLIHMYLKFYTHTYRCVEAGGRMN